MYYDNTRHADLSELLGQTLVSIEGSLPMILTTSTGERYQFKHHYDCCEDVYLEDTIGDIQDLIGSPITMAEHVDSSHMGPPSKYSESYTWTFYKLATLKGYVTLRFLGESNGYYSESVDFEKLMD